MTVLAAVKVSVPVAPAAGSPWPSRARSSGGRPPPDHLPVMVQGRSPWNLGLGVRPLVAFPLPLAGPRRRRARGGRPDCGDAALQLGPVDALARTPPSIRCRATVRPRNSGTLGSASSVGR